jgi:branched-chain amino acid transport system substrate-binding protein
VKKPLLRIAVAASVVLVAGACGSSSKGSTATTAATGGGSVSTSGSAGNKASAPGVTASTIKIGLVTSETGDASSTFSTSAIGAKAYFDAINKAGGIDGRQIQLITKDDTSSPAGALTATQLLLHQGVYGIIANSSYFFGAYKAAQAAGVPVTAGSAFDGPEWGLKPNTNMFSGNGDIDPNHGQLQAALTTAALAQYLGVKNVGGLAYGISPSSISSIKDMKTELESEGLRMGYENLSVPFGTTDVSSSLLAIKSAGVDLVACSCVQSTVLALVTGLKQSGSNAKSVSFASADSSLFSDPTAAQSAQGVYYTSLIPPLDVNNTAATIFEDNIKAADPSYQIGTYPNFGVVSAYLGAAVMAKGLEVAGQNPTRQTFITNLSKVTGYTANGLLPSPVSFNHFGTAEKAYCEYDVHVSGKEFVAVNGGKPFCRNVPSNL